MILEEVIEKNNYPFIFHRIDYLPLNSKDHVVITSAFLCAQHNPGLGLVLFKWSKESVQGCSAHNSSFQNCSKDGCSRVGLAVGAPSN